MVIEPEIVVRHTARMANSMMQLLVATHIKDRHPEYKITGYDIKEWGILGPKPARGYRGIPKIHVQRFDMAYLTAKIQAGELPRFMLRSPCFNYDLLPRKDVANKLFNGDAVQAYETTDDDIVIHIRLEDIMVPGRHAQYGPLHLGFYRQVIKKSGKRPIFIGQLDGSVYSNALRTAFPDAVFLEGGSVLHDFETLRRAHHIVLAISTFSWMAAWFGNAKSIHFPMSGIMHPSNPTINMIPPDDPRYVFYLFPERSWGASEQEIEGLFAPFEATIVTQQQLGTLLAENKQTWEPINKVWEDAFNQALYAR